MSKQLVENIRGILKRAGLYCTGARIAVMQTLMEANTPITQEQIAKKLGRVSERQGPGKYLNKVTIYRTLETLLEAGLVHKAFMAQRAWHFELADNCTETQCHPHFTCKKCGKTTCLTGLSVPMVKGLKKGFIVYRQQVRLEGLCPDCAK